MAVLDQDLTQSGLDALEVPLPHQTSRARKFWRATWPKLLATAIVFGVWEFLWLIEWKPRFAFPSPDEAFQYIFDNSDLLWHAGRTTLGRGLYGFVIALVVGTTIQALARSLCPRAIGSMITGSRPCRRSPGSPPPYWSSS
jgi:NitT/TauT family transport system permease protein